MFGITGKVIQGSGGKRNMDIAALAHIARLSSPSFLLQNAINKLIVGLKADGVWDRIEILCVHPSTTSAESLYDLKGVQDSTIVDTPTYSSSGWTIGSGTGLLNMQYSPVDSSLMNSNNSHIMTYFNTALTGDGVLAGCGPSTSTQYSLNYATGTTPADTLAYQATDWASGLRANLFIVDPKGFFVGSLLSGTAATRANGTEATNTGTVLGSNDSSYDMYIGDSNGAFLDALIPPVQCTAWAMGGGLTAAERANYYTHIQEYMVTMGLEA